MNEFIKKEIKEFWLSRWDYIGCIDAIKEARDAGYKYNIGELRNLYNEIEEYNL